MQHAIWGNIFNTTNPPIHFGLYSCPSITNTQLLNWVNGCYWCTHASLVCKFSPKNGNAIQSCALVLFLIYVVRYHWYCIRMLYTPLRTWRQTCLNLTTANFNIDLWTYCILRRMQMNGLMAHSAIDAKFEVFFIELPTLQTDFTGDLWVFYGSRDLWLSVF